MARDYQGKRVNPPYRSFKLFLDIVPSSFADITRALRGCFRRGSVYVSKTSNAMEMSSLIFFFTSKRWFGSGYVLIHFET